MKQFFVIFITLIFTSLSVFSQEKSVCNETTNYLIDKEMPSVYLRIKLDHHFISDFCVFQNKSELRTKISCTLYTLLYTSLIN